MQNIKNYISTSTRTIGLTKKVTPSLLASRNKKIIRFVESFILFPIVTMSMPLGALPNPGLNIVPISPIVSSKTEYMQADSMVAFNQAIEQEKLEKQHMLEIEADAIDAYFKKYKMPLEGTGMKMAVEADKNGLDWRLLPAIAVRESTGGKHACKKVANSFFGWGSCKIGFNSVDEAIEDIALNLSGNDADTAKHYSGKTTKEILQKYNPPSIVPHYAEQVMKIMNAIGDEEVVITPNA